MDRSQALPPARKIYRRRYLEKCKKASRMTRLYRWERVDSNHRRRRRQIYSLLPLSTRAHSQLRVGYSSQSAFERQGFTIMILWPSNSIMWSKKRWPIDEPAGRGSVSIKQIPNPSMSHIPIALVSQMQPAAKAESPPPGSPARRQYCECPCARQTRLGRRGSRARPVR